MNNGCTIFITRGNGRCVLNNFHPLMTNIAVASRVYGMVEGCVIVSIDSSRKNNAGIVHGVVVPHTHRDPRYLAVPYGDICFPPLMCGIPRVLANLSGILFVNAVEEHVVPRWTSRQSISLPDTDTDADQWIAARHEDMSSLDRNKVIGWTSLFYNVIVSQSRRCLCAL